MSAKNVPLCLLLLSQILVQCSELNPPDPHQKTPMEYPSDSGQSADGLDVLHLPPPEVCKNLPAMTEECVMGSDGQPLKEVCQVSGKSEIPEKTYTCGKGLLKHQAYLCNVPNITDNDLKGIRCTVVAK